MSREDIKDCDEYTKGFYDGCTEMGKHFDKLCDTLRETKRALWLARVEVTRISAHNWANYINTLTYYCGKFDNKEIEPREMMEKWQWVERKCREKAEEYL